MNLKEKLQELYNNESKHYRYQNIPIFVQKELGYYEKIDESWRGDTARFEYIMHKLTNINFSSMADIGANTGFFTLSLADKMKEKKFAAFEPNESQSIFIETVKNYFDLENILVLNRSVGLLDIQEIDFYDCVLLLNVLHHAGVDFDLDLVRDNLTEFEKYFIEYMGELRKKAKLAIFQLGYNWGGNKLKPIIPTNSIVGMISYQVDAVIDAGWKLKDIALFTRKSTDSIGAYIDLPRDIIQKIALRDTDVIDELTDIVENLGVANFSEFYKRPMIVLENPDWD